jgi:hypothetical protein
MIDTKSSSLMALAGELLVLISSYHIALIKQTGKADDRLAEMEEIIGVIFDKIALKKGV